MEFWGVEVKAGEPLSVSPEDHKLIHISQVALGEVKKVKSANCVPVRLTVGSNKFVIGTLSAERGPQIMFDLVLEKDFELSHDWKDGSVYFCGYTAEQDDDEPNANVGFSDESEDESEDEEELIENGKPVADVQAASPTKSKAAATKKGSSAKPKVTVVDPKKEESDDSDDGSDDDNGDDESDDDDVEDDSDDDMSEDEETPTPKKAAPSKKRSADSEIKTPASTKKSKTETPKKTDGKKGSAHIATPHPSKKSEKKTTESPKSSSQVSCKTCSKTFNSEKGLESHSKAKHAGK